MKNNSQVTGSTILVLKQITIAVFAAVMLLAVPVAGNTQDITAAYLTNVDLTSIPASVQANMLVGDGNVNAIQPGFEIPSDWRYKLGLEYVFLEDWVANFDISRMESDQGLHWVELARVDNGARTADGGRIIYEPIDRLTGLPTNRHDMLLTNAPGGDSTVMSLSLAQGLGFWLRFLRGLCEPGHE